MVLLGLLEESVAEIMEASGKASRQVLERVKMAQASRVPGEPENQVSAPGSNVVRGAMLVPDARAPALIHVRHK